MCREGFATVFVGDMTALSHIKGLAIALCNEALLGGTYSDFDILHGLLNDAAGGALVVGDDVTLTFGRGREGRCEEDESADGELHVVCLVLDRFRFLGL